MSLKDELKKTGKKVAPIVAATLVALTPNAAKAEENNTPVEKGVKIEQVSKQQSRTQLEEKDSYPEKNEAYNFASKEADIKDGTITFEDGSKIEQESTAGGNRVTKVYRADGSLEEKIERSSDGKDSFYEYDKDGFLKQVVEVNAENGFHYEYDKIGRLRQYGELGLKITSYNRDGSKQIEERKDGENMEEFKSKEFYPNGNLKSEIYYKVEGKDLDRAQQRLEAFNNNESLPGYGYEKVYTEKGEQSGEVYYVNGKKIVEHGELSDKDINTSDLVKYAWNRSIDTLDQEVVQRIKDMFTLSKKTEEVQNMPVKTAAINKIKNMR